MMQECRWWKGRTMELRSGKRRRTSAEADRWSSIPAEIFGLIAHKVLSADDFIRLGAVCRSWHQLAADLHRLGTLHSFGPYHMCGTNPDSNRIELRNPSSDKTLVLSLAETVGKRRCWGSPFGWLITYDPTDLGFSLLNPFTGATVSLPDLPKSKSWRHRQDHIKAFLTANPDSDPDNYLVVVVTGFRKLAFVMPGRGRKNWSYLQGSFDFQDMIHFQGTFYGIQPSGDHDTLQLVSFQFNHRQDSGRLAPVTSLDMTAHQDNLGPNNFSEERLVEISGHLCLCVRYHQYPSTTTGFKVFKINLSTGNLTQLQSLAGHCLYLGNNYSFSHKGSYSNLFGQLQHGEFVSNYVFYYNPPFDLEVWDMSSSCNVHRRRECHSPHGFYQSLWILPSLTLQKCVM